MLKKADAHCREYFIPDKTISRKVLSADKVLYLGTGMTTDGSECPACVLYILHAGTMHFIAFNAPHVLEQFWHATGSVH